MNFLKSESLEQEKAERPWQKNIEFCGNGIDHYGIPKRAFLHERLFPTTRLSADSTPLEIRWKDPKA